MLKTVLIVKAEQNQENEMPEPEEVEQDVQTGSSSVEVAVEGVESQDVTPASSPETPENAASVSEVDEKGVPWKNREAEIRRKITEEMTPWIQQQIQEGISRGAAQPIAAPQTQPATDPIQAQLAPYNDEQLEGAAISDPQNAVFYRREMNRRIEERATKRALDTLQTTTRKQTFEQEQQAALGHIGTNYDEAFVNLPTGQRVWNAASPLYQRAIQLYQSRPSFKDDGWGLAGAFDMAYGQLAREQKLALTKQKTQLTAQQRKQDKVQSQAMMAGGQSAPVASQNGAKVKLAKLMEQHKKTGDPKIMAEILKLKGAMPAFD